MAIVVGCVVLIAVVLPWSLARVAGEPFLAASWPLIRLFTRASRPLVRFTNWFDTMLHRVVGIPEPTNGTDLITEEIRSVIDEGQREGLLHHEARTMIHRVMELKDEDVVAVMTPRTDMHTVHAHCIDRRGAGGVLEFGHSACRWWGRTSTTSSAFSTPKDLLGYSNGQADDVSLRDVVRPPIYVPETTHIDRLLERMKKERVHIAIVIDEYSGVAGLVTMEDILEEIVGEITDEYDEEEDEGMRTVSADVIEVDGRVHIDDLNERFAFDLPEDGDFETIGGFVFTQTRSSAESSRSIHLAAIAGHRLGSGRTPHPPPPRRARPIPRRHRD